MLDRSRRIRLGLERVMLRTDLFALAREQGGEPLGIENVDGRVDELAAFDGSDELARGANRQLAGAVHVNDGVVRPVRDETASAPRRCEPGGPRVGDAPNAQRV